MVYIMIFITNCLKWINGTGKIEYQTKKDALQNVLLGISIVVFVSISVAILNNYLKINKDLAKILVAGCCSIIAYRRTGERFTFCKISLHMILFGSVTALIVYFSILRNSDVIINTGLGSYEAILSFVSICIVTPFYEELVVRSLLFKGVARLLNVILSSILISLWFAFDHSGIFIVAFIISIILCFMTYIGVNTINRSIFHGSYNTIVLALVLLPVIINK